MIGKNRVVVTGVGVLAANGIGKDAFWNSLLAGESGIGPITQFDASDIPWKIAGEVTGFKPEDFIDRSLKPKRQSRNTQLAAAATVMALKDAKLDSENLKEIDSLPIVLGISLGGLDLVEQHTRRLVDKGITKGLPTVSACVHVIAPSFISSMLGIETKISVISNSCTGGLDAVAEGARLIREGICDTAIVGGTDAVIIPSVVTGLGFAGMLADNTNLPPEKMSRPFDSMRSGGVIAEGSGVLVLESYDHALNRGKSPYAEILGYGASSNINSLPAVGLERSMKMAIENSSILPSDINSINAHGSSDPFLDISEVQAIKNVFGIQAQHIPTTSIKGSTGNPLAAGGAIQSIMTALSLKNSTIPPTTNLETPDPMCDLDFVARSERLTVADFSLINSHGTGGVNSSLILGKV
ncbi:beta-ketoacyl-[acyl-carrier-protein] synthase family protein [Pontiella agarivorans]|uniref:Beta-ketoacyl-[acyl-carrier-protein] synthase family protein n=1 Tax=Pontiella agarivorans TaxID=3038953 RepID=A0ABU5MV70_9BACT|nr:beta-ketoacyl-[acyl-carrier-protein] synthase family protein [Pontiella agarivorans]MDZ8118048.1 beta-ketoacyl-[acyl-carrier-protein] synthase family protein [Pontiella agarivorans]